MLKKLSFIGLIFISATTYAQKASMFTVQDSLLGEIGRYMKRAANPATDSVYGSFSPLWESIGSEEKRLIGRIVMNMHKKGMKARPHFEDLFGALAAGITGQTLVGEQMTRFLEIADSTAKYYPVVVTSNFLHATRLFLENKYVYQSNHNSVEIIGGTFSFGHVFDGKEDETAVSRPTTTSQDTVPGEWFEHLDTAQAVEEQQETSDSGWGSDSVDDWGTPTDTTTSNDGWGSASDWGTGDGNTGAEEDTTNEQAVQQETQFTSTVAASHEEMGLPAIKGPYLQLDNVVMVLSTKHDTITLKNTRGSLLLNDLVFVGEGGRIDWANVGFNKDMVYAELDKFSFSTKSTQINAENAKLTFDPFLDSAINGYFQYASVRGNNTPKGTYPRFESYDGNVHIKGILPDVDYTGGFSLEGRKISSRSFDGSPAEIDISKDGFLKFRSFTKRGFTFEDSVIYSPGTSLTIYRSMKDSIFHPSVSFKYDSRNSYLVVRKDKDEFRDAKFEDTYHRMSIEGDFLMWDLTKDTLDISNFTARDKVPLVVESNDYYDDFRFKRLRGVNNFHPLQLAFGFARKSGGDVFYVDDLAKAYKMPQNVVRGAMKELHAKGYVTIDDAGKVVITRKGKLYVYANSGRKGFDYDNIRISSRSVDKNNATINLKRNDLVVRGIRDFLISDSMRVLVTPTNGEITINENRNIAFSGKMIAGKFIFRGSEFLFNYDSFTVKLAKIDSLSFLVADSSNNGELSELPNNIVNTGGTLFISKPNNKSGLTKYDDYPRLNADRGGTIFFNGREILDGAYDERIRFEIPPFEIDSVNSSSTDAINFQGTFKTAGIFPDFEQLLSVNPVDRSFGFQRRTPTEGYPLYEGKGKYFNEIALSNKGIRGKGWIEYLSGRFESEDFIFYPDSVTTLGAKGVIKPGKFNGIPYPAVKLENYLMSWIVQKDSMLLTNTDIPFDMYIGTANFKGTLALSPLSLFGSGLLENENSLTNSQKFAFEEKRFTGRNSSFRIKSNDPNKPALLANDVKLYYDIEKRYAEASVEKRGKESFSFPYTEYATSLDKVFWQFDEKKLVLAADEASKGKSARFTSLNQEQDSLAFDATNAEYDLNTYALNIDGVTGIRVANVRIKPYQGKVVIRRDAAMDILSNAEIELNAFTKNHILTNGNIKILSRGAFEGDALYAYINNVSDTFILKFKDFQMNELSEIRGKEEFKTFQTTAESEVAPNQAPITIFAGISYRGNIHMVDSKRYLEFDGIISLDIDRPNNQWFTYKSVSEDDYGVIKINQETTVAGESDKLKTGLFLKRGERDLYASFIQFDEETKNDYPIFTVDGNLKFDHKSKNYSVSPPDKFIGHNLKGNQFVYNHVKQEVAFDGKFAFIENTNKFSMDASGVGKGNLTDETFEINTMLMLKFEAGSQATSELMGTFERDKSNSEPANPEASILQLKLAQFLSEKELLEYQIKSQEAVVPLATFFNQFFTLSNVNLKWSKEFKAFYSVGNVGMSNIYKTDVDSEIEAYIEIPKASNHDAVTMFLRSFSGEWYYIQFEKGKLKSLSSNVIYNGTIANKKTSGTLDQAMLEEVTGFLGAFRLNYLGIEEPLEIIIPDLEATGKKGKKKKEEGVFDDTIIKDSGDGF